MDIKNNFGSECIFLLGAGASADAGIPISTQLNKKVREKLLDEFDDESKESELFNFLIGTILFHQGLQNKDPEEESVNVEDVVSTLKILKNKNEEILTAFVGSWHEKLRKFDKRLLKGFDNWLNSIVVSELNRIAQNPSRASYLDWFADLHDEIKSTINIFTLNHDIALELILNKRGYNYNLGFDKNGKWNPELFQGQGNRQGFPINIFKLHGSLGWEKEEDTGLITRDIDFSVTDSHLMIFGILQKLTIEEPFFELVKQFKTKAREASLIVVIGYSFLDQYINQVLFESLRVQRNKRILVVDKYPDRIKRQIEKNYENKVNTSLFSYLCKNDQGITNKPKDGYGTAEAFKEVNLIEKIFHQLEGLKESPF
ncbi:SIR2 family protein [Fodinibius salsisoli]|uniref:SIR2 family protein n=1 Tax=Fodinibius salsisoli TaxID=2820877 RepID=A0ABT3PIL0_9BACT|nr:SIR2 family protein [Fodinibius salsisoli]MCW9705771.1 SIR2 family protein [Fodinibius salsisoli]